MNIEEIALTFECEGSPLIGIVHKPEKPAKRGVLAIVAGGPQYRAGCCRQLVYMARDLSAHGIPVMRFDYRGMGDSDGDFRGFQHVENDFKAAINTFIEAVPGLEEIVLWGGCDAASAILINAWRYPNVTGMIIANPFASSDETRAAVERQYYLKRLRDKAFWAKVIKLKFNPLSAIRSMTKGAKPKKSAQQTTTGNQPVQTAVSFTARMLDGLKRYRGSILLLMSGRSLTSQEFDELVARSSEWRKTIQAANLERVGIPEADQAFSTVEARIEMIAAARNWMLR